MLTFVLALIAALLALRILAGHARMWRMLRRDAPTRAHSTSRVYPSLTVIRPIKGLDVGCRENTLALLGQDYPGELELLFIFDSASDPAYPLVAALAAEAQRPARVLLAGARPAYRTGKLNAMIHGFAQARGELVAFSDSDSRPATTLLRELVEPLIARAEVGSTFAPAVTLGTPSSFAELTYGLLINTWYGASAAEAAGEARELPFIMGQIMVLRRTALKAIGGLEAAEGQLVDDMFLGGKLSGAGFKNVMVRSPLHLVTGPLNLRELEALLHKWMTFSRAGLPPVFVRRNWLRGVELGVALVLTVSAVVLREPLLALVSLTAVCLWLYSQVALYRRITSVAIPLRYAFWAPLLVPFVTGLLLLASQVRRSVEWRGQSYVLDGAARLAAASGLSARGAPSSGAASAARPLRPTPVPAPAMAAQGHRTRTRALR